MTIGDPISKMKVGRKHLCNKNHYIEEQRSKRERKRERERERERESKWETMFHIKKLNLEQQEPH